MGSKRRRDKTRTPAPNRRGDDPAPAGQVPLRKKLLYTVIPCLTVVAYCLVIGEIILRLKYERISFITGAAEWRQAEGDRTGGSLVYGWDAYHPELGWSNLPGYRSDSAAPFSVVINSQGLRATRDYTPAPPSGTTRIAMFGDSTTFGDEVDGDQTVPAHLQQAMANTQVLNFGVHSYGLGQAAMRMKLDGLPLRPDHVILMILTPHMISRDPQTFHTHPKPCFSLDDGRLTVTNTPVPEGARQPWLFRYCYVAAWAFGRPTVQPAGQNELALMQAILRDAKAACDAQGVRLTVVNIQGAGVARRAAIDPELAASFAEVSGALAQSGVDVLDLTEFLRKAAVEIGPSLEARYGHWSGPGNRLIAEEIARHLSSRTDP